MDRFTNNIGLWRKCRAERNETEIRVFVNTIENIMEQYNIPDLTILETMLKANAEGRVVVLPCFPKATVFEDETCSRCESCGSGEWLANQDENENNYCGQCGIKLEWPAVEKEKTNE